MRPRPTAIVIDDDPGILKVTKRVLEDSGFSCQTFERGRECLRQMERVRPDLAFVDVSMPDIDGLSLMGALHERDPDLPVVVITAYADLECAVRSMHDGAYEFLAKPLDLHEVRGVARRALEARQASQHTPTDLTRAEVDEAPRLIGRHPTMVDVYKAIGALTSRPNTTTVLITGETGSGKGLVARAIHDSGPARQEPFVTVHCAGVPVTLIENELFGHERGAFTGATGRHDGRIVTARGGTVFLDEIGELSAEVQVKLLRLLETGEFERLGGNQTLRARCRFIAATNRGLIDAVERGEFRKDLYYRLNVVEIHLPPLRQRREDIPLLVEHFLAAIGKRTGRTLCLAPEALEVLKAYHFPGNARELMHILEGSAALTRRTTILPEHLPPLDNSAPQSDIAHRMPIASADLREARRYVLEQFERQFVAESLRTTGGNVSAAARRAGVRRQYFQRLMHRYGVSPRAEDA